MLDLKHDTSSIPPSDDNNYTYGTASAAIIATQMLESFPSVRFGLMIGIGGGVPSADHDIRLGDIVVSTPTHGHPGVV